MSKAADIGKRTNARAVLASINAAVGQDFHTLSMSQVTALLAEADRVRYQKPRGANGSRGRYFFQLIQRQATLGGDHAREV